MADLKVVRIAAEVAKRKPKFREGDDVVLKGHAEDIMTVEDSGTDYTTCIWHDSSGVLQRERFKNTTLRRLSVKERVEMK